MHPFTTNNQSNFVLNAPCFPFPLPSTDNCVFLNTTSDLPTPFFKESDGLLYYIKAQASQIQIYGTQATKILMIPSLLRNF